MNNKTANKQLHFCLKPACAAVLLAFAMQTAQANPIGASVVNGQASFAATGNTLTVTNTPGAIINWQGFSIGANEITRFAQQSAASAVLNRVISNNPSSILGTLQSNGRVFLVNPNGIVFGAGSTIDVAGMVASTLNLSNADFLAGRYNFTHVPGAANISNAGSLTAQTGGQIYLIAPNVENTGVITAPNGEILLAAGHSVDLVDTTNPNLRVSITAPAGDATNVGQLIASSGSLGLFGTVVKNSGQVSADSATLQGGKIVFKASQRVEAGGTISAKGVGGGTINMLADMQTGTVNVTGTLDASAPNSGNGGFIETSAAHVQVSDTARISTAAAQGNAGMWLLDPYDFTIAATGGDITGAALSTALGAGAVTIQTTAGSVSCTGAVCGTGNAAGNGDIFVNDAVSWSVNTLTLTAARNINLNAVMTASGTSILSLDHEFFAGVLKVGINPDGSFRGRVDFPGRSGAGMLTIGAFPYTVINSVGSAGSLSGTDLQGMNGNLSGFYALGSNIDASLTSGWNGGLGFSPVGTGPAASFASFNGRFDGLGHTITGLTINRPTTDYVGLFGFGNGARIRNVGLSGGSVTGRDFVGGLVGYTWSGGSDKIANSYYTGTVTGISTGNGSVGGLVGANYGSITDSYSTANVNGVVLVGGLAGWNRVTGAISSSYSTGAVSGGLGSSAIGGVVGMNEGAITNSFSTGSVSGTDSVGGLVGFHFNANITNSYSAGSVAGSTFVGGLVGQRTGGSITSSYWDTQTSLQPASAGGTGLLTAQMKQQVNFSGWDFTNTWRIEEGVAYPTLRAFWVPPPPINTDIFWDGGAGDWLWLSALNWSGDTLPTSANHVLIDTGAVGGSPLITVTIPSGAQGTNNLISFEHLLISSAASLAINGTATINANLTSDGTTSFNGTGTHSITGAVSGTGTINLIAGTLTAGTAFNIGSLGMSGGSLALGNLNSSVGNFSQSAGTLSGTGNFTVSNSYSQTGGSFPATFNNLSITQALGDLSVGALQAVNSIALTATAGDINLNGNLSVVGGSILVRTLNGNLNQGATSAITTGTAVDPSIDNVDFFADLGNISQAAGATITSPDGAVVYRSATNSLLGLTDTIGTTGKGLVWVGRLTPADGPIVVDIEVGPGAVDQTITANYGVLGITNAELATLHTPTLLIGDFRKTNLTLKGVTSVVFAAEVDTVILRSNGLISQDPNATITVNNLIVGAHGFDQTLVAPEQGVINLAAANQVGTVALETRSVGGDITFNNSGAPLQIKSFDVSDPRLNYAPYGAGDYSLGLGVRTAGANVAITNDGAITDSGGGLPVVTAASLEATAVGGIALTTQVANLTTSNSGAGNTLINNTGALIANGMTDTSGSITLNNAGSVTVGWGGMSASGIALTASGAASDIFVDSTVTSANGMTITAGRDLSMNESNGALIATAGSQTINVGRDMSVIQYDSGDHVRSWAGLQTIHVGRDLLVQSNCCGAAYIEGSAGQIITVGGNVTINGGRITGNPDVGSSLNRMIVGGNIYFDDTGGDGEPARIESVSGASIWLHYPNLSSGGYFVNGAPVVSSGSSGFFAGGLPAVLDSNLHITYRSASVPFNLLSFLPDLVNTMLIPGGGASGSSQSTIDSDNKKPPATVVAVNDEILPAGSDAQPLPVCPQ